MWEPNTYSGNVLGCKGWITPFSSSSKVLRFSRSEKFNTYRLNYGFKDVSVGEHRGHLVQLFPLDDDVAIQSISFADTMEVTR